MADITISYKGNTIAEISASGTTTLETAGKYCEDDITIEYVRPNVQTITDDSIYLYRLNPYNSTAKNVSKLVGCTYAWNQLYDPSAVQATTTDGVTFTKNADGSISVSGTATADIQFRLAWPLRVVANHKMLIKGCPSGGTYGTYSITMSGGVSDYGVGRCVINTSNERYIWIRIANGTSITTPLVFKPQFIDLTLALGAAVADYIYGLGNTECATFFKNLFPKDYYPYDAGTLVSVKPTASTMKNADESSISSYPLSGIELRGLPNLVNNAFAYDGDEYLPDGTVNRKYGIRSYQSGDESLADAITDGTNTVYKLQSATAESTNPYTARQTCYPNGTEEFVDGRTVEIPVNAVADYEVTS